MSGVNRVILLGNLGKDPEVRHLENGRARASFTLATDETYKNKEGARIANTEWHNVVLWTPLAEVAEKYLNKGKQVYIEGKLASRSYVDKEGQTRYFTEIVGQNLVLLGGKRTDPESEDKSDVQQPNTAEDEHSDGLPF
ncbi:MAG: single-stranded DNA-binding protein [Bacteroidota bacterium]